MAQFRTTADILDLALHNAGEVTNGNSPYETQALNYLNRVHFAIVSGGTIPIGKDTTVEIDEVWPWSRAKRPLIIELQPKYNTGTITLTQGSEAGVFSSAPAASLVGYHLKAEGREEIFKIVAHTAASVNFEIDGAYPDETASGLSYRAIKLDYELSPSYIVIDSSNNKFEFKTTSGGSILTATLTAGVYSPSDLATHVATQMTTAAAGPTITGTYSAVTRFFSFTTNAAGATTLIPQFSSGTNNKISAHRVLGFDDADIAAATTHTSTYVLGGLSRIIEPFKIHKGAGHEGSIFGIDSESFQRDYPLSSITEGFPDRFSVIHENSDGIITVRFNAYSNYKTRVEIECVEVPHDLKDNASSIPLIPRKSVDVLEDAATFYIMLNKSDDRMQIYSGLMQGKLKAMIAQNRGSQVRTGKHYGQIPARAEKLKKRRKLSYGYTSGD